MPPKTRSTPFFGWRVVAGTFVLAAFGWGTGFYGPPVFLSVIRETRGWPVSSIAAAVTTHFLIGAVLGANLPGLHRRLGAGTVTKGCAFVMATGLVGWSLAEQPWQLFAAGLLTGAGWGGMSAAALNCLVSPWFERGRPAALAMAYNGASIGGVIFSPLWVAAIGALGFTGAMLAVALVLVVTVWALADGLFSRTPDEMGLTPDGARAAGPSGSSTNNAAEPPPIGALWRDRRFLTLAAGMSLGLFAQIGLVAHLYSLLAPALGAQMAGFAMALVTAMAIAGRSLLGWLMPPGADRRLLACIGYAFQLSGSLTLVAAQGTNVPLLMLGIVLFGAGFGNATSLPPLVAQAELARADVSRVVALIVGISQGCYAFAPAMFGLVRELTPMAAGTYVFAMAALVQAAAIGAFWIGRHRRRHGDHSC